jgi:hypothetical protein
MFVGGREGVSLQSVIPIEGIDFAGFLQREELSARVCPFVLLGAGYVDGAWGNEGEQFVLIHGKGRNILVVGLVFVAEPPREGFVDTWYGLALVATRQGCSRTTRIVGDDHCEALILSATPERCLAQT